MSASVAKLRDLGVVVTEDDPSDRRRTLVRVTALAAERGRRVRTVGIEDVLVPALGSGEEVSEVVDVLERLARRLTPEALAYLRGELAS